jgi:hypothetical protein
MFDDYYNLLTIVFKNDLSYKELAPKQKNEKKQNIQHL